MRGSITIFATMLLMLVSQFLFTVLEAGRNLTLTNIACMNSEAVAESVFAQYCRPLWDEYHLLAYDAGSDAMGNVDIENVKSYMKQLTTDNFKISDSGAFAGGTIVNGTSMLRLSMDELESMKYVLMTDDGGDVYTNAVVSYMKKNIGYETVKNLYIIFGGVVNSFHVRRPDKCHGKVKAIVKPCCGLKASKLSAVGISFNSDRQSAEIYVVIVADM